MNKKDLYEFKSLYNSLGSNNAKEFEKVVKRYSICDVCDAWNADADIVASHGKCPLPDGVLQKIDSNSEQWAQSLRKTIDRKMKDLPEEAHDLVVDSMYQVFQNPIYTAAIDNIRRQQNAIVNVANHPNVFIRILVFLCMMIVMIFFVPMILSGLLKGFGVTRKLSKDVNAMERKALVGAIIVAVVAYILKKMDLTKFV